MYEVNIDLIKDSIVRDIYSAILGDRVIKKHTLSYSFLSGSSTLVNPISFGISDVEVYVDCKGNSGYWFRKAILRVVDGNSDLFRTGYYCKVDDGSSPSFIRFKYSDTLMDRISRRVGKSDLE